ncbi:division/cell wall cluster transcriptional repressor MraZ [soil metagenome]
MMGALGTYLASLDDKGRLRLPSALKEQLPPEVEGRFVLNRGLEKCIKLLTLAEWELESVRVGNLDEYDIESRDFKRKFFGFANRVVLDGADRMLLPKVLMDYAGINKEVVFFAQNGKVEIWDKNAFYGIVETTPEDYAKLGQRVLGKNKPAAE